MSALVHLWQSTLCVALAVLLSAWLRHAPGRTRHLLWLFASAKFLVPFSALTMIGSLMQPLSRSSSIPHGASVVRWLDQSLYFLNLGAAHSRNPANPFDLDAGFFTAACVVVWLCGAVGLACWRWRTWRAVSRMASSGTPLEAGREVEALTRASQRAPGTRAVSLVGCKAPGEPSVFGVLRPQLLWPAGLSDTLSDAELDAIVAHEVCHVRRSDNAAAVLQMSVEVLFWFHPVVWWLSARLVQTREQACDEEVLRMGADKRTYAEGILKVCGFCLRSPLACVAGVGGSHLARRVEAIMGPRPAARLSGSRRMVLVATALLVTAAPLATGLMLGAGAPPSAIQSRTSPPRVIKNVNAAYPAAARQARIQGAVVVEVVVRTDGTVGAVTVIRSLDKVHGLDNEAVKAARQWRFEPGTRDGKPVAVAVELEMTFTLR